MPALLTTNPPPFLLDGDWGQDSIVVTAAQTFKAGDFLIYDAAGTISIAAAASNDVGDVKIFGIAKGNAAQLLDMYGAGAECPIAVPTPNSRVLLPVYHGTAASAVIAQTDMDTPLTVPLRNQGGIWCANKQTNGANDRLLCLERHLQYPFSETFGWFWWKLIHGTTLAEGT